MTTVDHRALSQQEVLEAVGALAPAIAARAAEIEAGRRIPPDLLGELIRTGVFRILRPPSLGGAGADLPAALRAYEALARPTRPSAGP
jgi:alkylation response protein AidB-like acyl-CoA dehydrogenase